VRSHLLLAAAAGLLAILPPTPALGLEPCGSLGNAVDYRTAPRKRVYRIESVHFPEDVETLRRGSTSRHIGKDITFVLRNFPNHPRALIAMAKLAQKEKADPPAGSAFTVACWFDRALRLTPNDPEVYLAYGVALLLQDKPKEAITALEKSDELRAGDANVHYNLGLAYFDLDNYDKSLEHAKKAYELGFPLQGLRNKLESVHRWQ
jgi:tetratricopeptide (TPR) repeat protein